MHFSQYIIIIFLWYNPRQWNITFPYCLFNKHILIGVRATNTVSCGFIQSRSKGSTDALSILTEARKPLSC